jgi:hypothetical protein
VKGILADINVEGQQIAIVSIWNSEDWREIWHGLGLSWESFRSLGLPEDSSDADIWRRCQREKLVLITANRNDDTSDSLEATIRGENQPDSLPVVTIANPTRVMRDRHYAEAVAIRLLDYLIFIDSYRGTGRLFVP